MIELYRKLTGNSCTFASLHLIEQYLKNDRLIIAYDIDDTVRSLHSASCEIVPSLIRMAKDKLNAYLIVYTSNCDIEGVENYLKKWKIPYDSINENAPFAPKTSGKIFYNLLLDDKAGLGQACEILNDLIFLVENNYIEKVR